MIFAFNNDSCTQSPGCCLVSVSLVLPRWKTYIITSYLVQEFFSAGAKYEKGLHDDMRRNESVAKYAPLDGMGILLRKLLYSWAPYRLEFQQFQHDIHCFSEQKGLLLGGGGGAKPCSEEAT